MTEISYRSLVWLTYRLGATLAFGFPFILWIWSSLKKESSIIRLLTIYWKVVSLMAISMLLLTGNRPIGYLTSFISPILIVTSIWFWIDLNEELDELSSSNTLVTLLKIWRWAISIFSCLYAILAFSSLNCISVIDSSHCLYWQEAPQGLLQIIRNIFKFLFGSTWTETISAFLGYLGLIIYLVGILQWIFIRFPKKGRIAGGF